jgi:hypothetical protein
MTSKQQAVVDLITHSAIEKGILFELGTPPRDDREGFRITVKNGPYAFNRIGIAPDGWAGTVEMSQSYDKKLSTFVRGILNKAKKLRSS